MVSADKLKPGRFASTAPFLNCKCSIYIVEIFVADFCHAQTLFNPISRSVFSERRVQNHRLIGWASSAVAYSDSLKRSYKVTKPGPLGDDVLSRPVRFLKRPVTNNLAPSMSTTSSKSWMIQAP